MSAVPLLLAQILLTAGTALQTLLLPVRAGWQGFPTVVIGALGSAHNIGFVAGCLLVPRLVARLGHGRAYGVLAALVALAALGYAASGGAGAWLGLRLATGFGLAGLSAVVESWINLRVGNGRRGRSLALYAIAGAVAGVAGQMLLPLAPPGSPVLFIGIAAVVLASALPVLVARGAPPARSAQPLPLRSLYRISPVGLAGCLFIGLANGAFWQLAPVYAQGNGLSRGEVALFMSLVTLVGALAQWPVGHLSDRRDRRWIILGCLAASLAADLLMAAPRPGAVATLWGAVVFGACVLPIYSLCLAHTNDLLGREHCVAASGGLLLAFGVGAVVGPLLAAGLMQRWGAGALFHYMAAIHVVFAGFVGWRLWRRRGAPLPGIAGAGANGQATAAQHGDGRGGTAGGQRAPGLILPDGAGGAARLGEA